MKKKHKKKNILLPCSDANQHCNERIALVKHREEVKRKLFEKYQEQMRRRELENNSSSETTPDIQENE